VGVPAPNELDLGLRWMTGEAKDEGEVMLAIGDMVWLGDDGNKIKDILCSIAVVSDLILTCVLLVLHSRQGMVHGRAE